MNNQDSQPTNTGVDPTLLSLLDQMGFDDPKLRMFAQLMALQGNQSQDSSSPPESDEDQSQSDGIAMVLEENERLAHENDQLLDRVEVLAAALGACPICWGEDDSCSECRGKGRPGYFRPDREAFAEYVLPVVKKLKRVTASRARDKGWGAETHVRSDSGAMQAKTEQHHDTAKGG